MHLYMVVRGANDRLARWVNDVYSQHYPWKAPDGNVKQVRLTIRPIQLFECVFPETAYVDVLATLQPYGGNWDKMAPMAFALRKLLGVKPIQKAVVPNFKVDNNFVHRIGIGVKLDKYHPDGWEML